MIFTVESKQHMQYQSEFMHPDDGKGTPHEHDGLIPCGKGTSGKVAAFAAEVISLHHFLELDPR